MKLLAPPVRAAALLRVTGVVQGVGFRPFVHRLAAAHGVAGWVRNGTGDVQIAIEGAPDALASFERALGMQPPPASRIDAVERASAEVTGLATFTIVTSADEPGRRLPVTPDLAMCPACERELFDPADRRYHYPFITCTDCGPRFSIIGAMPYDRERTSMNAFEPCAACRAEYETPGDRRYHSETNSCPACGPRLRLVDADGRVLADDAAGALRLAAAALVTGQIVAIRGLGGFHLACDASSEDAIARLRRRKRRDARPLAVMVRTIAQARSIGEVEAAEAELLGSPAAPIVLVRRRPGAPLAAAVAPGMGTVGVMLPYTPLHQLLLLHAATPLVMTSGNASDEPIATGVAEAVQRLRDIADLFLVHDRDIVARYDDSVVRVAGGAPLLLRRSRGYAPLPLRLPVPSPAPLLAVGAHQKSTLTLATDGSAYVSQHIGDLEDLETLDAFHAVLERQRRLFRIAPRVVAHDEHPGYLSTRIAQRFGAEQLIPVQHHHAHVAAVAAEHGVTSRVIGVAFDGTGRGSDGRAWGAEFLIADLVRSTRAGHLRYARMPGGDLAARRPWRAAEGYLALDPGAEAAFAAAFTRVKAAERALAARQIGRGLNAPFASSMGRLFDAAAAVLGVRHEAQFEGQAAMELEALAGFAGAAPLPFPVHQGLDGMLELDPLPLLVALGERRAAGADVAALAAAFHESVATATITAVRQLSAWSGCRTVVLGGGCFQNARLVNGVRWRLEAEGLRVLVPRLLPPNDGAISFGQAAIAAARLAAREE